MKKFIPFVLSALMIGFTSCNNDDPDPEGFGDVFIISKLVEPVGESEEPTVVYGLYIGTSTLNGTPSAVSATVGSTSYTLEKNNDTGGYSYESDEYSTELPAEGTYTISYTFTSGDITTSTNVLTDDVLIPANITSCTFADSKIEVEWDAVEDADVLYVQLKDDDGESVFSSITTSAGYLDGDETEYSISTTAGSWKSGYEMNSGETYTVEVVAFLAESATSNYIQAQSIASSTVVWGE
jgi:hypothetical protein